MGVETKYALLMETADETLSDIWSRLSGLLNVDIERFDHDEDLLIFSTVKECAAAQLIIETHVQQPLETLPLLLLPDNGYAKGIYGLRLYKPLQPSLCLCRQCIPIFYPQ